MRSPTSVSLGSTAAGSRRLRRDHLAPINPAKLRRRRGYSSYAWHEGGAFLIMRPASTTLSLPDGVATIGCD